MSTLTPEELQQQKLLNKELFVQQVEKECCKEHERIEDLKNLIANLENGSLNEESAIAEISNIFRVKPHLIKGINHWLPADKWVFVKKFKVYHVNGKECKMVKDLGFYLSEADERKVKENEEKLRRWKKKQQEKKEEESEDDFEMFEKELRDSEGDSEKNGDKEQKKKEKDNECETGLQLLLKIAYALVVILFAVYCYNVFQLFARNGKSAPWKPSQIDLEQPQVEFHGATSRQASTCRLLRKEISNEDPNVVIFVFEAEMEQPWAKLTGDWSKYPYKFEKIEDNSNPRNDSFIWDRPHKEIQVLKYPVNLWEPRSFWLDFKEIELKIETSAPIEQKSMKCVVWLDCELKKHVVLEKERQKTYWNSMISLILENHIDNILSHLKYNIRSFFFAVRNRIYSYIYNILSSF